MNFNLLKNQYYILIMSKQKKQYYHQNQKMDLIAKYQNQ